MQVGCQNRVQTLDLKGINYEGNIPQFGLHGADACHVGHLMADLHLAVAVGTLAVACPEVNCDVGAAGGLEPHTDTAEPPHGYGTGLNIPSLDLLSEPCAPLRESAVDPFFSGHFRNFTHSLSS